MACEGITPHGLHRSAARCLVEDELIPEKLVMEIGGWKTGSTFKRYHIISDRGMRLAAGRILNPMDTTVWPEEMGLPGSDEGAGREVIGTNLAHGPGFGHSEGG